jgi:hypothetical protein
MLFDHLHVLAMSWWVLFWVSIVMVSGVALVRNIRARDGAIFWWTVLLFFGVYKTMRALGVVSFHESMGLPLLLFIAGAALVAMVVAQPARWHMLVPAAASLVLGTAMLLAEMDVLAAADVRLAVRNYWPVALILFGAALLLNRSLGRSRPAG